MIKSTLTLIALSLFFISNGLAQQRNINMALMMASPENEDTFDVGTSIRFILILENLGPDALVAGDSIFVQTPDDEVQFIPLEQGLAIGESDTILSGDLTIPVDSTITFNLCSTLSDDPNSQIQLNGNPATVTYKDPDPSNNAPCNLITILVDDGEAPSSIGTVAKTEPKLLVYPNPTRNQVTLENFEGGIEAIRIVNMLGAEVYSTAGNKQSIQTLDISKLANGIYMLHIQTDEGTAVRKLEILK